MSYYCNGDYFKFQEAEAKRADFADFVNDNRALLKEQWPELWQEDVHDDLIEEEE